MNKKTVIIFTTRLFDKDNENYLFNPKKCLEITLNGNSSLGRFHVKNQKEQDVNYLLWEKFHNSSLQEQISFLQERRSKVDPDNQGKIDSIIDSLKGFKKINMDDYPIEECKLFFRKKNPENPVSFDDIINKMSKGKSSNLLNLRNKIYKRKDRNIFGYRCLDLYDDLVDSNSRGYFISSIVRDIAFYLYQKGNKNEFDVINYFKDSNSPINEFFSSYHLVLVLHEEDIGYPKGYNKYLLNEEKDEFLIKNNRDLEQFKESIDTYVFQHTANIFVRYLTDFDDELDADGLSKKFQNYTKNRNEFETIEKSVFEGNSPLKSIKELKKILRGFAENTDKIY